MKFEEKDSIIGVYEAGFNKAILDVGRRVNYFMMDYRKDPSLNAKEQVKMKRQHIDK